VVWSLHLWADWAGAGFVTAVTEPISGDAVTTPPGLGVVSSNPLVVNRPSTNPGTRTPPTAPVIRPIRVVFPGPSTVNCQPVMARSARTTMSPPR
jgi:hypothetical protein